VKHILSIAFIATAFVYALPARAEVPGVLSGADARTYHAIFDAQKAGNIAKAEALASDLSDKSLMGYVLADRYLAARHYKTSFSDLKSWLETYADLPPAGRIYSLALKRRPNRRTAVPAPVSVHWRTSGSDDTSVEAPMQTARGQSTLMQFRGYVHDSQPDTANAILKTLSAGPDITQADIDRLSALVSASYLAEGRDADALALAESTGDHGSQNAPLIDWTAGLAAYRSGDFARAAKHFEALSEAKGVPPYSHSGGAFWAARSYMRANHPDGVITLYANAASEPHTFYGALAARLLGQNISLAFDTPTVDMAVFNALMRNRPAHRAIALHQQGKTEYVNDELMRAYNDISPDQAVTFAAIAHEYGDAEIQLKASQLAARNGTYLSTLYPVPKYAPRSGYQLDTALMLAFARQESGFNDDAVSRTGARGVMQVMPGTAAGLEGDKSFSRNKRVARKQKLKLAAKLDNPKYNMELGQKYLTEMLGRQNGNLFQLAAAYNAGPGNLSRWLSAHEGNDDPLLFIESIPARETRFYIKQVMMNLWMYQQSFGQSVGTLNDAASGQWPIYAPASGGSPLH
jgi:soluble lytic murein transglycosylase